MKIAFIGIGNVGFALANNLQKLGHDITIGNDNPNSESVKNALSKNRNFTVSPLQAAIDAAEVVFLATPFAANEEVLKSIHLDGKILVDCTNPVGPGMIHGLNNEQSGSEFVQSLAPKSKVVKAFTVYGFENFENTSYPKYKDVKPSMFIAGNDTDAKKTVSMLCNELGWDIVDTGDISNALHLEHMTLLWIKMARVQGKGSDFVWAMLER